MDIRSFARTGFALCTLVSLIPFSSHAADGSLKKRAEFPKAEHASVTKHTDKTQVVIKFKENVMIRQRVSRLVAMDGTDLAALQAVLNSVPVSKIERVFTRTEDDLTRDRDEAQRKLGKEIADPNLFFTIHLPESVNDGDVASFVDALNRLEIVEVAYIQGVPVLPRADIAPQTPNYEIKQGYLGDSPNGINWTKVYAQRASFPGVTGANVTVADVEYNWTTTHEDLKDPVFVDGTPGGDLGHGTAVLGILVAQKNAFGVSGIVPDAPYGVVSINGGRSLSQTIDAARARLTAGDVMLVELGQFDSRNYMVPAEYDSAAFTAIQLATAAGIIVVEPAGNGYGNGGEGTNLDAPYYQGIFNRAVRDSGAIFVGAAEMGTLNHRYATFYSNYGTRMDSFASGNAVVTTGHDGGLFAADANQLYTADFSGTSSAGPMVAGSAVAIQSYYKQLTGRVFTPWEMRALLTTTGTAASQQARYIGTLPNLLDALNLVRSNAARIVDSDHDGLFDTDEVALGTNPNAMDTDGDAEADSDEVRFYLSNPKVANASLTLPRSNDYNTLTSDQFQWTAVPGADFYQVYLTDAATGAALINVVLAQTSYCTGSACKFTSTVAFADGHKYTVWLYTFPKGSIAGGWSSPNTFTSWTSAPPAPTLVSPTSGGTTSWKPTFSWKAQSGALGYNLVVADSVSARTDRYTYITPSEAGCGSGQSTCSYTWPKYANSLSTGLLGVAHTWWINTLNPVNVASAANSNIINVALSTPAAVKPTSPINGATVTSLPVLQWQSTPYATYYWIDVVDGKGVDYGNMIVGADIANCANGETTCSWQPTGYGSGNVALPVGGTSKWRVGAANSVAASAWSAWATFIVK